MTEAESAAATALDKATLARVLGLQHRRKTSERRMKRCQYARKEDFYRRVTDTIKTLGYSLLGQPDVAVKGGSVEARFDAFVERAEAAMIAVVNECLLEINALERDVRAVGAEAADALGTLADVLGKEEDDDGYVSARSSLSARSKCQVSTRQITRALHTKISARSNRESRAPTAKLACRSRSASSMSSGRTYVLGLAAAPAAPAAKTPWVVRDLTHRKYVMREREAMFEERRSRPVVLLPKVSAKGAWGQSWHVKMVERKPLSLRDLHCRNKYAENRMGDSFQVFKEVKAIWRSNMMCNKEEATTTGVDKKSSAASASASASASSAVSRGSMASVASMLAKGRSKITPRSDLGPARRTPMVEKVATEEEVLKVTQYEDADDWVPKWVKRVQKKEA